MESSRLASADEPPDGDFVRYVESLVGSLPSDPEVAAREQSRRMARGAAKRQSRPGGTTSDSPGDDADQGAPVSRVEVGETPTVGTRWGSGVATSRPLARKSENPSGPPDLGVLMRRFVAALLRGFGTLLIIGGVVWIGTALVLQSSRPEIEPFPGVAQIFAGIFVRSFAARLRSKA
ncbi:MAG: hypothetical protein R3E48_05700 [Burkholderiaceae bacterium]